MECSAQHSHLCTHHDPSSSPWMLLPFRPYQRKEEKRCLTIHGRSRASGSLQALSLESLSHAHILREEVRHKEVVSLNYVIQDCIKQGKLDKAFIICKDIQADVQGTSTIAFVSLIKAYTELGEVQKGHALYDYICEVGLMERDNIVGNTLVSMYAKFCMLEKAKEVFDNLPVRTVVSWNALISGYAKNCQENEAIECYKQMQLENVCPNLVTYICALKACKILKIINEARQIHDEIVNKGYLEEDIRVGNALIDTYATCGFLEEAHDVLTKLSVQNVISWTAIISGCIDYSFTKEALNYFEQMQESGISPNDVTFMLILKVCSSLKDLDKGQIIHCDITKRGLLELDFSIGSTLIDTYVKCGSLTGAQAVFDTLPILAQNVFAWTALITGYIEHGCGEEALNCYDKMEDEGISPNSVTCICCLRACSSIENLAKGREIHSMIAMKGLFDENTVGGNALIDMYSKCGELVEAQYVFNNLPRRDRISWNTLMAGYVQHGCFKETLTFFDKMQCQGFSPDAFTFVCCLKACDGRWLIDKGREIHAEIAKKSLEGDLIVGNALVDMYRKCGSLLCAKEVLSQLPIRDVVTWNSLMEGYIEAGYGEEALNCFEQMQLQGVSLDVGTYICGLKACGIIQDAGKGQQIYNKIAGEGIFENEIGSALVDMFSKCGLLSKSQDVFDHLPCHDVVSWTSLISSYVQHGLVDKALTCFELMKFEGVNPDAVTYVCTLRACMLNGAIEKGREIHDEIVKSGLETNDIVANTLIDIYAKWGLIDEAQEVFERLSMRNVISWTVLIAGYVQHGKEEEALTCFELMRLDGSIPDAVTFVCILKACSNIGARCKGSELHDEISMRGLFEGNHVVGNALVDMYAKCGFLTRAQEVFNDIPVRDEITWSTLIAGYAQFGDSSNAFIIFNNMLEDGLKPSSTTFTSLLTVCSHTGLIDKGQICFKSMTKDHKIGPTVEHHTCMIDLLGRAGQLDVSVAMMDMLQFDPDIFMWQTLLSACQRWGNMDLGRQAFDHALRLNENNAATYVHICNIFVESEMQ